MKTCEMLPFIVVWTHNHITFISHTFRPSSLTLIHLILTTFYTLSGVFVPSLSHPFKILYNSPNNHNRVMYKSYNFDLASPSIDHSIKFRDSLWYAREIDIEVLLYICVSTLLRVIHLNIYTISTICNVFKFMPLIMIT